MNFYENKTIVAIATPPGYGGIGVIRLSGSDSLVLTQKLLSPKAEVNFTPNQAAFHYLVNNDSGEVIDEAIITYFKAPHSFTGEDVVEISCHGSPVILAEVVRLLLSFGATPAEPGEFTMRAFLNHRIDLSQAEAVNDLIHAQTAYQARVAAKQLRGELSRLLQPIKDRLVEMIVHFESVVEFVEDDLDPLNLELFISKLDQSISEISRLISSYSIGRIIRSGVKLALIGRPNVGKSSIFNRLLEKDRAIVTPLPGTTRDTLVETFSINGIPVDLIDTAGIRETDDLVEQIGVERTRTAISEADIIVAVLDATAIISERDFDFLKQLPISFCVINKCDLGISIPGELIESLSDLYPVVKVSALTGQGIEELRQAIYNQVTSDSQSMAGGAIITNERHYLALEQALNALRKARHDLGAGFTEEVVLVNLHDALRSLGVITGETLLSDIINQIFSTFCIGK
jgi:tRNA modification GTPase